MVPFSIAIYKKNNQRVNQGWGRRFQRQGPHPWWLKSATAIQIPYSNSFRSIWEYDARFRAGEIDFLSYIGPICPVCERQRCYREIAPYNRYAIDLDPFKKEKVWVARFLCSKSVVTFSLLPTQLIPYVQYTSEAVIHTLWVVAWLRGQGQQGYYGAMNATDPEGLVTSWLIYCWACMAGIGFRKAHAVLCRFCDFSRIQADSSETTGGVFVGYFQAISPTGDPEGYRAVQAMIDRYARTTKLFLFGTPSQDRKEKSA